VKWDAADDQENGCRGEGRAEGRGEAGDVAGVHNTYLAPCSTDGTARKEQKDSIKPDLRPPSAASFELESKIKREKNGSVSSLSVSSLVQGPC
jgi:hypothetical protein